MVRIVATITIESEAVTDAIDQLRVVYEALPSRHGERFRRLEHKIEAMFVADDIEVPKVHMMGDRAIIAAPEVMSALLAEARELGLVR